LADTPRVRARWSQRLLEQVAAHDAALAERLDAALPAAVARIREASPLDWVELEHHVQVLDRLLAECGPARFAEIYRPSVKDTVKSSLLRTLVEGTFKLFGDEGLARGFPTGWSVLYQNGGEVRVQRDPERRVTTIELAGMSPVQRSSAAFVLSMRLAIQGLADSLRETIAIDVDAARQHDGVLLFHIRRA
jgi:hypothetical protein